MKGLRPPDWNSLVGDAQEARWIADRDRKFSLIAEQALRVREIADHLSRHDALFQCSRTVLQAVPDAAEWYVSLAGFAKKTLTNVKAGPRAFGLTLGAPTLIKNLQNGRRVDAEQLEAFSRWINDEVNRLYPVAEQTRLNAEATVLMIFGGRVVGKGQNIGGDDAVVLVKVLLADAFESRGYTVEAEQAGGRWVPNRPEHNLADRIRFRCGKRLLLDFGSGGNRPDLIVTLDAKPVVLAEIKGRKDTSNVWESWMPTIHEHLRTWAVENPAAARIFMGTLITQEMVDGISGSGTVRVGLRDMHHGGLLTSAYNISKVIEKDPDAVEGLDDLVEYLAGLMDSSRSR